MQPSQPQRLTGFFTVVSVVATGISVVVGGCVIVLASVARLNIGIDIFSQDTVLLYTINFYNLWPKKYLYFNTVFISTTEPANVRLALVVSAIVRSPSAI